MATFRMVGRLLSALLILFVAAASATERCRCLSFDPCWPKEQDWNTFNSSIDGVLIALRPVASVCYSLIQELNACRDVREKFTDPFWRASQPSALQAPNREMLGNQGCPLDTKMDRISCLRGSIPTYAVAAWKPAHVQKAILFAAQHNLRLVIKNSGHELTGRNTAPGSLSIWMQPMKDIKFLENFRASGCSSNCLLGPSAVKVGAGVLWNDLYRAANATGKTVVGAQCASVGAAGGYPLGGGHSQISPSFGLAADNVLEFEIVTADGQLLVANDCVNQDLFWALRGGGGGTFGVVLSVTYKTHPVLKDLIFASYVVAATSKDSFQDLVQHFISVNPNLSQHGWGGFFMVGANQSLIIQYLLPNKNMDFATRSFEPLLSFIRARPNDFNIVNGKMETYPSYYDWYFANLCPGGKCGFPSGFAVYQASRLIPRRVVEQSPDKLAAALIQIQSLGYQRVSGYLVAGGKVSEFQDNAVNPAWRHALFHVLFLKPFELNATIIDRFGFEQEITGAAKLLRDLTPGSGAYLNEADPNEPDWQESFYGSNYKKLRAIKDKVDPKGLFVCSHCVGSEDWPSNELNCRK